MQKPIIGLMVVVISIFNIVNWNNVRNIEEVHLAPDTLPQAFETAINDRNNAISQANQKHQRRLNDIKLAEMDYIEGISRGAFNMIGSMMGGLFSGRPQFPMPPMISGSGIRRANVRALESEQMCMLEIEKIDLDFLATTNTTVTKKRFVEVVRML